jgi:hypothetical protein
MGMIILNEIAKRRQNNNNQSGNTMIIVIAVILCIAIIGGVGYVWFSQSSKNADTDGPVTPTVKPVTPETSGVSVTMLGGKLNIAVPEGWTKGTETNLIKDFDGTSFRIAIQPQGVDLLKSDTVGGYATEFSKVKSTQGTQLFILKLGKTESATNLVVSTCAPANGFGCSPDFDSSKLYVTLAPLGDGSSVIAPLDYNLPATTKAITDFETITKTLPI